MLALESLLWQTKAAQTHSFAKLMTRVVCEISSKLASKYLKNEDPMMSSKSLNKINSILSSTEATKTRICGRKVNWGDETNL